MPKKKTEGSLFNSRDHERHRIQNPDPYQAPVPYFDNSPGNSLPSNMNPSVGPAYQPQYPPPTSYDSSPFSYSNQVYPAPISKPSNPAYWPSRPRAPYGRAPEDFVPVQNTSNQYPLPSSSVPVQNPNPSNIPVSYDPSLPAGPPSFDPSVAPIVSNTGQPVSIVPPNYAYGPPAPFNYYNSPRLPPIPPKHRRPKHPSSDRLRHSDSRYLDYLFQRYREDRRRRTHRWYD